MKEETKKQILPIGVVIIISMALFSGHFGVGDVLFPPVLGRKAGQSWVLAALGYGIINSLGVLVAYLAVAQRQQTLFKMASNTLGKKFGVVFTTICMLIIGPVFILPRVSSATHEMSIAPFFPKIPLLVTLLIFFALNAYVAFNRTQVIDRIGKVFSPVLIVFMFILIIKGIVSPIAALPDYRLGNPLTEGIIEGYNTMNAMGAALMGGWILNELSMRKVENKLEQANNLKIIGGIVALALLATSIGITYIGATTGAIFPEAQIGVLTMDIAESLLGFIGKVIFAIILAFACFTTSVGLTSTAGDVFEEMSDGKLQYKNIVIVSSIVGFLIGLIGLSKVVGYTTPWLMLVYPALLILLIGSLYQNYNRIKSGIAVAIITAIIFSIGYFLAGLGFPENIVNTQVSKLPLGTQGLGWIVPAIIAFMLTQLVYKGKYQNQA